MSMGRRSLSCSREKLKLFFLGKQSCLSRRKNLNFSKEQMCSKFCSIVTFGFEFWLKYFYLQSCSSSRNLSNDRSKYHIRTKMKWLWLQKDLEHMFPWELRPFPKESTLFLKEGAFLHREFGPFLKENYMLLEEVVFFTRELFLFHGELVWVWHL